MESSIATAELSIFLFADPKTISCHRQHLQQTLDDRQLVDILQRQTAVLDQKTAFLIVKTPPLGRVEAQVMR